jgi:DNA repair exonuclease SbcCD ATPase subunit
VWIDRLEIEGFRRLSGDFRFSPSLTVVVGDNEAGKSSLHEALVRAVFGFSAAERRRSRGTSQLERRAPWDGRPFRLVASVRDADDHAWRIEWDFSSYGARLFDPLAEDVTHEVPSGSDGIGRYLLRIDLDDFLQVCCIDQADLAAVRHSPNLGIALQEAVVNVSGDTPVEHAVERLNELLKSIGANVRTLNPTPTGRLMTSISERHRMAERLSEAEDARAELVEIARERVKATDRRDGLVSQRERARQASLALAGREADERLAQARDLDRRSRERPEDARSISQDARDEIAASFDALRQAEERLGELERDVSAVADRVAALEQQQRQLVTGVDELSQYAGVDDSARDEVQATWARLDALGAEESLVAPGVPERDGLLERYRRERDELEALASRQRHPVLRVLWIVLVVVTLGLAWLVRAGFRRVRGVRGELPERLREYGVSSLDELDARVTEEDRRIADAEAVAAAARGQTEDRGRRRVELLGELNTSLDRVNAPAADDLEARVRAYLLAAANYAERRDREASLEKVRRELEQSKGPIREQRRAQEERAVAEARLRDAYRSVGIEEEDLSAARAAFERLVAAATADQQREQGANEAAAALASILGDESLESLETIRAAAREALESHRKEHGNLVSADDPLAEIADRVGAIGNEIEAAVASAAELTARADALESEAGDPAELKEQMALLDERIANMNDAKEAAVLARETLEEAADELKREFAPHLNEALRRNLAKVTGGRYSEALVDGDLAVRVVVPETGQLKPADELSRATRDQLFLVQRLEIARLLAPTKGSAPLLLDDPFAHYDRTRLRHGLELIAEAATERQIVLFSEDPELGNLAREVCSSCAVITLDAPVTS